MGIFPNPNSGSIFPVYCVFLYFSIAKELFGKPLQYLRIYTTYVHRLYKIRQYILLADFLLQLRSQFNGFGLALQGATDVRREHRVGVHGLELRVYRVGVQYPRDSKTP